MLCTSIVTYMESITPVGWNYKNITRPFSIIYYVVGGEGFYTIDGVEFPFRHGHLYILPANKKFSLRENTHNKFTALYVHAFTSPFINNTIDIDTASDPFLTEIIRLMRAYATEPDTIYIKNLTNMLISYIFERNSDSQVSLHLKLKEYIEENFVSVFKRNTLPERFNFSKSHLTRIFKEEYNLTPKQYAEQLILKETVALLNDGHSIAEISERLNFSSPENLSRFFKKCYGYSPSKYRKHFKNSTV